MASQEFTDQIFDATEVYALSADYVPILRQANGQRLLRKMKTTSFSATLTFSVAQIDGWPVNAAGALTNDGSGNLSWVAGGGAGDVVGPASATDNAIARFDSTTGKLIQNSAATIADTTGDITAGKYNKVTITAPASGATLTIPDGVTLNAGAGGTLGSNAFTSTTFATAASPTFTTAATFSFLTAGRIPFAGTAGLLSDDASLIWDNTNKRFGIGTTAPSASIDNKGSMTGHTGVSGDVIVGSEVAYGSRIRPTITAGVDGGDLFGLWINPDFQDAGHTLVGHLNLYSGPPQASFDGSFTPGQTVYATNFFGSVNVAPSHFAAVQAVNQDSSTSSTFGINTTVESRHTSGTKSQLSGIESDVYTSTAGNVTTMAGFIAFTQHSGAGTVAKQVGLLATSGASTGTATLGAGVYIANGSMHPTTKHGLYVETQTGGGTNYSLFVNGGLTHLGGIVEAGSGPTTLTDSAGKILSAALNTVGVAQGGTGLATLTANNVILGNGTSAPLFVAPGTSGNVLTSDGTTWTSAAPAGGGLTVGTSTIASGTTTRVLFDNAGVLGEYVITGTGNVVMSASPTLTGTAGFAALTTSGNATISGQILAANGSVSAPGMAFSGFTSSGWYFSGTHFGFSYVGTNNFALRSAGEVGLLTGGALGFVASGDPAGGNSLDTRITRNAAGVLAVGTTSNNSAGSILMTRNIVAKTGNYTVVAADSNTFFTNTGAGAGVNFTLPTAVVGQIYEFYRDANQTVTITAGASTTIRVGSSVTASAGNVTLDAVGSKIRLTAISTTQWVGDVTGTATFN